MGDEREVRLRPEFAHLYEGLESGAWLRAREWAAAVVDRARRARAASVHQRTFDPRHFEFRGGEPARPDDQKHHRTRSGD